MRIYLSNSEFAKTVCFYQSIIYFIKFSACFGWARRILPNLYGPSGTGFVAVRD